MIYHVTDDGPRPCTARPGRCPVTVEPERHYDDKASAQEAYYLKLEETHALFSPLKREIELPCAFGTMKVKDGDLSDLQTRTALISGLCGSLALAVHDKTGGTPYFVCYELGGKSLPELYEEGGAEALIASTTHALVESTTKPGTYIDAYGQKTLEELKEFYGEEITLEAGSRAMLESYSEEGVPQLLENFAKAAVAMAAREESYSYMEFT